MQIKKQGIWMQRSGLMFILTVMVSFPVIAKDLGTWGELYPIAEQDMLTTINTRLQAMKDSGELDTQQEAYKKQVIEKSLRPAPVAGLTLARENRTHYINPSMTVAEDLADHQGRVFAHKGDVVNPLDTVPFNQTLYFIDGDNPDHLDWIKRQKPDTVVYRVILVNGDIREATKALGERIFFDQKGTMSRRFELSAVPARVTLGEDKRTLRVDTFTLEDQR
jgi:conjugal transfer pilus assembly protein TraW